MSSAWRATDIPTVTPRSPGDAKRFGNFKFMLPGRDMDATDALEIRWRTSADADEHAFDLLFVQCPTRDNPSAESPRG